MVDGHKIRVHAFAIDRTEVTVREYMRCVSAGACLPAGKADGCNSAFPDDLAAHPINCVSFTQAELFCRWTEARLPTVAEWELAAGGTAGRVYPWGSAVPSHWGEPIAPGSHYQPGPARHYLCWQGDGTSQGERYPIGTCPVGSFHEGDTPSGIADLAGNVWEWTRGTEKIPEGKLNHIVKGGGFAFTPLSASVEVHVSDFGSYADDYQARDLGFRCVK